MANETRVLEEYWRSSASYRVRIPLNLKGLQYRTVPINLLADGQNNITYRLLNPQGLVPTLCEYGVVITQSIAIMEYLEEKYPTPPLLPKRFEDRAHVRQMAQLIASDVHPLQNLRVKKYLNSHFTSTWPGDRAWVEWCKNWIYAGFDAYETLLKSSHIVSTFSYGELPTLADCCLIPQVYNALRFECDMSSYPRIQRIYANCMELEAFQKAAPENQPNADKK